MKLEPTSILSLVVLAGYGGWWLWQRLRRPVARVDVPAPVAPSVPAVAVPIPAAPAVDPAVQELEARLRRLEATMTAPTPVVELPRSSQAAAPDANPDAHLDALLAAGTPPAEIARALHCSRAEVDLLLALRAHADPTP
jgi:hypothetical protein